MINLFRRQDKKPRHEKELVQPDLPPTPLPTVEPQPVKSQPEETQKVAEYTDRTPPLVGEHEPTLDSLLNRSPATPDDKEDHGTNSVITDKEISDATTDPVKDR